jgi:hypothetical protein
MASKEPKEILEINASKESQRFSQKIEQSQSNDSRELVDGGDESLMWWIQNC